MKENWVYHRGDVYYADLNPICGSEQGGTRPVLVLQNNIGNFYCPTLIVAPLTSKTIKKRKQPTHCQVENIPGLDIYSIVLLEQIRTIDKSRIYSYTGRLSKEQMEQVDEAIKVSLGLILHENI